MCGRTACTVRCGGGRKPDQSATPRGPGASRRPYLDNRVWVSWRGHRVADYERCYRPGTWLPEPRMRPEGDDRHGWPRGAGGLQHATVTEMDAVEAADRRDTFAACELLRMVGDLHSRASASFTAMKRPGSASSTENGPISSRRNVRQWPPRASAIARMYVPELTRSWRLLTHPDIRRVPRIAAFFDYIIEQREALKPILTG